jgi:glycosyltransferase involved in cell wall biosynthesis
MKTKIAILHPMISPYRVPLFERLSADPRFEIKVFTDRIPSTNRSYWESDASYGFRHENLGAKVIKLPWTLREKKAGYDGDANFLFLPLNLPSRLREYGPEVVISTELGLRTMLALLYTKTHRIPILVWSDEYALGTSKHSRLRLWIRRFVAKRIDGYCSCGLKNREYLESLGIQSSTITTVSIAVDNNYFHDSATLAKREEMRRNLELSGMVFSNIGQLVPRKGLDRLLMAWAGLPKEVIESSTLLIVGSGTEEGKLKKQAVDLGLSRVRFVTAKPISEIPYFYAATDVFILPTLEDGWGLVINEAMASGIPVLCSKHAGCFSELLEEGGNGHSFDPLDADDTRRAIITMFEKGTEELARMGKRSMQIVAIFNYDRMAEGFADAIVSAIKVRRVDG